MRAHVAQSCERDGLCVRRGLSCFISLFNDLHHAPPGIAARHEDSPSAPEASQPDVRTDPPDAPSIGTARMRLAQAHYIINLKLGALHLIHI